MEVFVKIVAEKIKNIIVVEDANGNRFDVGK